MLNKKHFIVNGIIKFPVQLNVFSLDEEAAIQYAYSILNSTNFIQMDADVRTKDGKTHYLMCDKITIDWFGVLDEF